MTSRHTGPVARVSLRRWALAVVWGGSLWLPRGRHTGSRAPHVRLNLAATRAVGPAFPGSDNTDDHKLGRAIIQSRFTLLFGLDFSLR